MTLRAILNWIRFGKIVAITKSIDGGVVSEIEFQGRFGKTIGYFAYGSYDPSLPYPTKAER